MVKQLFVVNTDAFAADADDVYADGKLGFISQSVNSSTGAAEVTVGGTIGTSPVQIAQGKRASVELKPGELDSVVTVPYAAGTKQKITISFANSATYAQEDGEYFVKVMDVTLGTMNIPVKTFSADYNATLATSVAALEVLIDEEGLKPDSPFYGIIADDTSSFYIEAPLGKTYRVAATRGATITYTTAPVYPVGTPAQVKALESECLTYEGFTNKVGFPVVRPDSQVSASATYDLVYAKFMKESGTKDGSKVKRYDPITIIFAVNKSNTTYVTPAILKAQLAKFYPGGLIAADLVAHAAATTDVHGLT